MRIGGKLRGYFPENPKRGRISRARRGKCAALCAAFCAMASFAGCSAGTAGDAADGRLRVVASVPIIADLVRNVAPKADISVLIPPGADPHSFEPSVATVRDVANADIAFTNGLLLEQQSLISTIEANLPEKAKNVALAQESVPYGAKHIHLTEDISLSTVWLGFRVDGQGSSQETVDIVARKITGPGLLSAFTTGTFGRPTPWITGGGGTQTRGKVSLPTNAHTHMSWGFSRPGTYKLTLGAVLKGKSGERDLGSATVTFAVGTNAEKTGKTVIDSGHMDITAGLRGGVDLFGDAPQGGTASFSPQDTVIAVPHTAAADIPDNGWRFLGRPGEKAWILAQAVLGRHVHGETDPHLWHDVSNAVAYVERITSALESADPKHAAEYRENAAKYREKLNRLDAWMRDVLTSVPKERRTLVTAHDSFGYLAKAYGFKIAGFVAPNPSLEPSVVQLANLTRTLRSLPGKAVFLEPTSKAHVPELISAAHRANTAVCEIYSDTFSGQINTYIKLMEFNTKSLKSCLDRESLPAWNPNIAQSPSPAAEKQ